MKKNLSGNNLDNCTPILAQNTNNARRIMSEFENEILDCKQKLNVLLAQVKNAEKWVELGKESLNELREKLFDLEARNERE